jgi:hypothetical protein
MTSNPQLVVTPRGAQHRLALANQAPVYRYLYTHTFDDVPDPVIIADRAAHFFDDPILRQ